MKIKLEEIHQLMKVELLGKGKTPTCINFTSSFIAKLSHLSFIVQLSLHFKLASFHSLSNFLNIAN
jgi:hypothetical protein